MSDIGSVSVSVVPNAKNFVRDLKAKMAEIGDVHINVDADSTDAQAKLEEVQAQADHLDGKTVNVKVKTDKSSFSEASSLLSGLSSQVSGIGAAVGALGPALIPLAGGALGLGAALGGPAVAAGGGLAAFGLVATQLVKNTEKALKNVSKLQAAYQKATPGASKIAALKAYQQALKDLTPQQRAFSDAQSKLTANFQRLTEGPGGKAVFSTLINAMGLLGKLLPIVSPLLVSVSGALNGLLRGFSKFTGTDTFKSLFGFFSHESGKAIGLFGKILGNLALGFGRLFRALTPQGNKLLRDFVRGTAGFAKGKGLGGFVDALKRDIPQVAKTVGDLFKVAANIVRDLAPYGEAVLRVINKVLDALAKVPGASGVLAAAGAGAFLGGGPGALTAGAVVGLAVAFKKLYDSSKPVQRTVRDLRDYFTSSLLPTIQHAAHNVLPALQSAFHDISKTIRNNQGEFKILGRALLFLSSATVVGTLTGIAVAIRVLGKAFNVGATGIHLWADGLLTILRIAARGFEVFARIVFSVLGNIVHGAAKAFGWIPGIGGKLKSADAAFHAFAQSVIDSFNRAGARIKALQNQIDGIHNKKFTITAQTEAAIKALERLQAWRIANKTFTITAQYQQRERVVGPRGGIGHHALGGLIRGAGSGTSDSIPSLLSNGEYVVNAIATAHNRALLDQLNSGRRAYAPSATSMHARAGGGGWLGGGPVQLVLDDGTKFNAHVGRIAQTENRANARFAKARGGG